MTDDCMVPDLPDGATPATAHLLSGPALTQVVIGGIIRVHQVLGPGYVENIYRNALLVELNRRGLVVECEQRVTIWYERVAVGRHRIDLLVNGELIIELKAVSDLHSVHYAQLRSYLKATGLHTGILVNFGTRRADFRNVTLEPRDAR